MTSHTDLVAPRTADTTNWGYPVKVSAPVNDNCPDDDSGITAGGQTRSFCRSPGLNLFPDRLLLGTGGQSGQDGSAKEST